MRKSANGNGADHAQTHERIAKLPPRYSMEDGGLFYTPNPSKANSDPTPVWVSAAFEIVCETDDGEGHAQGLVLQWRDRKGRLHQRALPRSACDPKSPSATELMDEGLVINPTALNIFRSFLGMVTSDDWRKTVTRTGWHEASGKSCFVLTNREVFGPASDQVIAHSSLTGSVELYSCRGSLEEWQEHIAKKAVGNYRIGLVHVHGVRRSLVGHHEPAQQRCALLRQGT